MSSGCKTEIGDKCVLSTDCSTQNERECDTSQPGGYCTVAGCNPNGCPDEGACIFFYASAPGCPYDDRTSPRLGRSFCMKSCGADSDCRDGYVCRAPLLPPLSALVLDNDQGKKICLARTSVERQPNMSVVENVCRASAPGVAPIDAGAGMFPGRDGGTTSDAGTPFDAGNDAGSDAGASDGGVDGH